MKTYGVGFLGSGDISDLHAEGLADMPGAVLRGLWSYDPDLGRKKAERFGCRNHTTGESLVSDPEIDVIFVLTPMENHIESVKLAVGAGKHVLVEKPVGSTVEEIRAMKDLADEAGVRIAPVHNYIYESGVMRTREMIDNGAIGDVVSVYVMYNIHHPEVVAARYPGVVKHIMTHHCYILLYLAGDPQALSCMKSTINDGSVPRENLAMGTLKMTSGALAHFCASFAADDHAGDPWTCMIKVVGTKGATRFSYRDWVENTPAVVHSQTYWAYPYSIKRVGDYFINRCLRNGEPPLSSIEDAIT
ncbi:MAG: Gfo/Idh/MocA family oxidoreductase, partial [Verrucomicrobiota bacterium]